MTPSGMELLKSALESTGAGSWLWRGDNPDTLSVQWPDSQAMQDIRGYLDDENWHHLLVQLQQALVDQQTFTASVVLDAGRTGHQLQVLGACSDRDTATVVGLCWLGGDSLREDSQSQWAPLAKLSHELRSPLAAVVQQTQELYGRADDTEINEGLASLRESAVYMLRIIEDMLNAYRAGDPEASRDDERLFTDRLVHQLLMSAENRASQKGLRLQVRKSPDFPTAFLAEPTALRRILHNLIDNAIKYTTDGEVTLSLRTGEGPDATLLVFEVSDTGPGMSAEELTRVFEPFARGSAGRRRAPGLGVGLAMSRQLAVSLGGDLDARSSPGNGSRFQLSIPARVPAGREQSDASPGEAANSSLEAARRVLLVDDQPLLARLTARALTRLNCEVSVANSADEALDIIQRLTPDLVILDLDLPDMSGCELCRELAGMDRLSDCRFVAYSGSDQASDRSAAVAAGFHEFFVKPVAAEKLLGG